MPTPAPDAATYTIQGRTVTLPVCVRDACVLVANFVVSADAVRRLLPTTALQPVELYPGGALMSLAAVEYRDNDLGQYNEVAINFFVRHVAPATPRRGSDLSAGAVAMPSRPGAPPATAAARPPRPALPFVGALLAFVRREVGVYVHRMPVTTSFSRDAGYEIWGYPKTVDDIAFTDDADRRTCVLRADGSHVLTLTTARRGRLRLGDMPQDTYTWRDGGIIRTRSTMRGQGVGVRLGGAQLTLGAHPIADELRTLGLPRRALMTMSMEHLAATFHAPEEV